MHIQNIGCRKGSIDKMKSSYDKEEDILNVQLQEKGYWKSVELPNGIVLDITKDGKIMGIEILRASKIFSSITI